MMDVTDRHCRVLFRLLSGRIRLYTEMLVTGALIHGDRDQFLAHDESEHPVALQLGGSDPVELAQCARFAEQAGYDEVNLNVGCPSDRVKNASFGACLMKQPQRVADCVAAMKAAIKLPVTVKSRTGVDELDGYDYLVHFVEQVSAAGCDHFIIHARKAWLKGLSPKQNRTVPPLHYDRVYRLKRDFPGLRITINGGIARLVESLAHLEQVDGVMLGREAYQDPWMLTEVDRIIFNDPDSAVTASRIEVVRRYLPYMERQLTDGVYLRHMTRHMMGLFHAQPGAKSWRRYLSEHSPRKGAGLEVVESALNFVSSADLECASHYATVAPPPVEQRQPA